MVAHGRSRKTLLFIVLLFCHLLVESQIRTKTFPQPTLALNSGLESCCDLIKDHVLLFNCVNASVILSNKLVIDAGNANGGPNLGVGVVSFATNDIKNYTAYSYAINAAYANHNRYVFHIADPLTSNFETQDSRWSKVKILEEALNPVTGWARDLDYVMWIDADLIFLDMGLRLEKIVGAHPMAHFFSSAEHAGSTTLINSGSVLVRNSMWARDFLGRWWTFANRTMYSDQEQFDMLYKHEMDSGGGSLREKVAILQPDAINSDPPAMTQQKDYNQVLHLMGEQLDFRVKAFSSGFQAICKHAKAVQSDTVAKNTPLASQLTVTKENLHKWTLEVYSAEARRLMDAYAQGSPAGAHSMNPSREMANSVHHYCHALEHPARGTSAEVSGRQMAEALHLRARVYQLMLENLTVQRSIHLKHAMPSKYPFPKDWPEHVKTVATAGQHLLATGTTDDRLRLCDELMNLMEEMLATSNPLQHDAVRHMIAHLHLQRGMIHLHRDAYDINAAYVNFKQGLDISAGLAVRSGEHILVQPLTMCANVLSTMERHHEAFPMYVRAINLSEQHLGPRHDSIGSLLVNYGISLVQTKFFRKAVGILERAVLIMDANDPDQLNRDRVVYQRAVEFLAMARNGVNGGEL